MSGSASLTLEQGILQHTLGIAAMAFPAQMYVALCAASLPPSESIPGVEAFGGGYARVPATFAILASPTNIAANTQSVEFPLATADWGSLGYFEIWTAQTGGSRLYWGGLVDPVSGNPTTLDVSAGDIVRFSAGTLAVEVAAPNTVVAPGVSSFNTRVGAVVLSNSDVVAVLPPSANPPLMDGAASVGTSAAWARGDHVHPTSAGVGITVRDFGAVGDGVADDTAAINAALTYIRSHLVAGHATFRLVFPAGRYVVTGPLNFTGFTSIGSVVIDGCGSEIWLKSATAKIDCLSSRWLTFRDLSIYGDPTNTPAIGIQIGRISTLNADFITMVNVKCYGNFSFAPLYNFASETFTAYSCTFDNNATTAGAWCIVQDGINHWNASSTFVPVTAAVDTPQSNNSSTFYGCTLQGNAAPGNVWMANITNHGFQRCYASNITGSIFVLYAFNNAQVPTRFLDIECHCETTGLQHMLSFTGGAGVTFSEVIGLSLSDHALQAAGSALAIDAGSAITNVDIRDARFRLGGSICPALFDAPAKYVVRATHALLHDVMWAMPTWWSGPVEKFDLPGTVIVPENQRVVAANAGSFTMFSNMGWLDLVPVAAIATFTAVMPPTAVHSQTVQISTTQTITALTLTPSSGQTIAVQPGTLTANTSISYRYDERSAIWLSLGRTAA